jgi:hypothetical protein
VRRFLALSLVLISSIACADDGKAVLARRLVDLTHFDDQFKQLDKACHEDPGAAAKKAYMRTPSQFGGISPQSAYWPEVEVVFEKFYVSACGAVTPSAATEVFVQTYTETLSLGDLQLIVDFYSSPAGHKLTAAQPLMAAAMAKQMQALQKPMTSQATAQYTEAITALTAKYRADPR